MSIIAAVARVAQQNLSPRHDSTDRRGLGPWVLALRHLVVGLLIVVGLMFFLRVTSSTTRVRTIKTNDQGLRQRATSAPSPAYPPQSLANNITGVVVAAVTIYLDGRIKTVSILESPDAATGRAVRDAVARWTFKPVTRPVGRNLARGNLVVTGNLVFYFHIDAGRGVVSTPAERRPGTQASGAEAATGDHLKEQVVDKELEESDFEHLRGTRAPIVLDIRRRAAHLDNRREGAVNIPLPELGARAKSELPRAQLIVIDCFSEEYDGGLCESAVHVLTSDGFSQVRILKRRRK